MKIKKEIQADEEIAIRIEALEIKKSVEDLAENQVNQIQNEIDELKKQL